ncbi:MAG: reverse transcriptase [Bacteroidaceae bacterium]|nr:reverse transcriptase [Bacteroidaceae bacterium]
MGILPRRSYDVAKSQENSNYWSVTEYNSNNAWNVNFGSGNVNNNNKYNSNVVRPVAAHDGFKYDFIGLPIHAEDDRSFVDFFQGVHDAYRGCMRGKMSSSQAIEYMQIAWADLPSLAWELWAGIYKPSTSTCFLVKYPKLREVFAANFRDRIVHHWVCLRLEPLFEMRFMAQGDVSFNCRKGYGTQKCVEHCAAGMKEVTGGYQRPAWIFKGDLVGFFMSIDKHLLWYLLERFIIRWRKREARGAILQLPMYWDILQRTTKAIVMHHPEEDCVLNSDPALWRGLPPNKSLFGCSKDKGEPIGNLTTQLFANFLMSFFDQYIMFMFRGRGFSYVRFVDDFCIVCNDKKFLLSAIPKIERFLDESLKLTLHKDKRYIQPASHGVALVGSYIKPNRIYLSNRTLARFEERIVGFNRMMEERALNELDCKRIEQVVNSYLGFCKGKRTYKRRKEILDKFGGEFFKYFFIRGHYESIRAKNKYRELELYQAL